MEYFDGVHGSRQFQQQTAFSVNSCCGFDSVDTRWLVSFQSQVANPSLALYLRENKDYLSRLVNTVLFHSFHHQVASRVGRATLCRLALF